MSMSLDGFIAGPNAGPGNGLGDGGERLHEWLFNGQQPVFGQVFDEFMATGAVVAGRGTFEPADGWGGDHHDGVPIWILSRREPGIDVSQWPLVNYVNDVTTAMTEAKRAAGDKNVLVHPAATAQLASPPASSTSSRSISSRCSSATDAVCSATFPSTSSSSAPASL